MNNNIISMVEFGKVNFFLSKKPKNKREEILEIPSKKIIPFYKKSIIFI